MTRPEISKPKIASQCAGARALMFESRFAFFTIRRWHGFRSTGFQLERLRSELNRNERKREKPAGSKNETQKQSSSRWILEPSSPWPRRSGSNRYRSARNQTHARLHVHT